MGYGKTYSPLDVNQYKTKFMVEHLLLLLDQLNLNQVIVLGHDWGTRPTTRFVLHHPERILGIILFSVGYRPPKPLDLAQTFQKTKPIFGYELLGYWEFFKSEDAASIIETNPDRFLDLLYPADPILWKTDFAPLGKAREWFINQKKTPTRAPYETTEDFKILHSYIIENMQAKLSWYKSAIENVDWNDEKELDPTLKCPVLYIGGLKDYICIPQVFTDQKKNIPDLETVDLDTSHWIMEEKPNEVNQVVEKWIENKI